MGAATAGSTRREPLPPDTEARITGFADLVAAAIANAETRAQLTASRARIVAGADEAWRRLGMRMPSGRRLHSCRSSSVPLHAGRYGRIPAGGEK
ncbi:hypothetical protein [Rhodococcus wratislaviensis]|uniref:Uncharacterized protein n=1 Tax=Rhodococcus wratislaviensis NBRC 100605 TaxID=1219028 RepID=X0RC62_RHOWR|nr:hypothetical protein [Rhodococcus wratislaviensis]GAF48605.1 hypothetical protein RW1_056_00330 [Rhodococcus wratislaviensis NBRC 100605]